MAGKSGRTIDATVHNVWKKRLLSWEGMLLVLFIVINIFCRCISPNYTVTNVLREMPKYLSEIFLLLPMAYILILGDIDISVGSIVCLSVGYYGMYLMQCRLTIPCRYSDYLIDRYCMWYDKWFYFNQIYRTTTYDCNLRNSDRFPRNR